MQHELQALEQRWGLALQTAAFGVWDLDPVNEQVHYSPQWKAMLGYEPSNTPDSTRTWRERVHPDDLAPMLQALRAHLDGRAARYEMEFRLRAADGGYRTVLSRGRVVERAADGQPLRMVGTLTDLTDRRAAEALQQARDRAEAASRAKTEFLSRMSHELRTPLNAVLGFAQLLSAQLGDGNIDQQRRHAAHIEQAGWQLLALVDKMLDLADMDQGRSTLTTAPLALAPVLAAACAAVTAEARQAGVQIVATPADTTATVLADAGRLQQVLTQLLRNAVRFNHRGGTVTVTTEVTGIQAQVKVADTGVGMSAQQLQQAFEPFGLLGRHGGPPQGVHAGLAISRWLAVQMGGTLAMDSAPGQGSAAVLTLKLAPG